VNSVFSDVKTVPMPAAAAQCQCCGEQYHRAEMQWACVGLGRVCGGCATGLVQAAIEIAISDRKMEELES
jgi:hypothetical protein